ncbi:putative PPE family protein PPE42 [Mycobacterium pseudokansasii]|uniref:Putative PPE family protein PPE42 n=1 Tax=Mycobacterium pseudokansasii TaxID=2341080 RepID=A0A498QYU5_9MYCO|nr:hypothetical protein A4G27_11065 [Mycobacterium kansasii]VBA32463.1 putative PPE family protein PPE42 [Mycobacterium pseudokansasii]VBA34178.1 putative PPE family protein PPE42 [Mycobacterium pseudokansasii]VBA55626.1 putative PPE family protein PPE42 [Mycobacterium pseudokansasii]
MNFLVAPPEINSVQMYSGAGSGPMLAAASAWNGLAAELGSTAGSFSSLISGLAGSSWQGPASMAMAAAAAPYARWLNAAAEQAGSTAAQAKATAAIYEAARAAVVHPISVAANRSELMSLVAWNLLGLNAPAIAATEAEYEEMWAQDVGAMLDYHGGASAVAAQLSPWGQASAAAAAPAQGVVEYGTILAFLASTLTLLTGPLPQPLKQPLWDAFDGVVKELNAVNLTSESVLLSQRAFNESEIAGAQAVTSNAVNGAVSALSAGNVGGAAAYLAGAGLYDAGAAVNLVGSNAVFPLTLLGANLQALGTALAP